MGHRSLTSSYKDLERHRLPLAIRLLAVLALVDVVATALSLVSELQ